MLESIDSKKYKKQKKDFKSILFLLLILCISALFPGCTAKPDVNEASSADMQSEYQANITAAPTEQVLPLAAASDDNTSEATESTTTKTSAITAGTVVQDLVRDIDGNGTDDILQIVSLV